MFTDSSDGQTGFIQIEVTYWNTIRGRLRCSEVWGLRKFLVNLNGWLTNNGVCVCVGRGGGWRVDIFVTLCISTYCNIV